MGDFGVQQPYNTMAISKLLLPNLLFMYNEQLREISSNQTPHPQIYFTSYDDYGKWTVDTA